jgi:RIO-like serine/threonine protein kinase
MAIQHTALHMPTVLDVDGRAVRVDVAPEWLSVREAAELGIRLTHHHGALLECDLVSAVRRLHNNGLVHGNVNEDTVYVREDGRRVVLTCPAPLLESPWTTRWHEDLSGVRDVVSLLENSSWWRRRNAR